MSVPFDAPASDLAGTAAAQSTAGYRFLNPPPGSTDPHLELLERAVTVALSALDFADRSSWGDALTRALCSLAGADAGAVLLPAPTIQWRAITRDPAQDLTSSGYAVHDEATERLRQFDGADLVAWARDDLAVAGHVAPSVATPGTVGIRVQTAAGHVGAICLHRDRALGPAPQFLIAALRAIAPAFRAGLTAWMTADASNATVARMLDSLAEPALMFDVAGSLMHGNPALDRLTAAPENARLRDEAQRIAWAMGAVARRRPARPTGRGDAPSEAPSIRRIQIGGSVYCLRGAIVGEQILGSPAVLVTITAATAKPLTDDALRSDFGLTAREIQVARLIAEGLSNSEIADRIGVRFFTARNHVERTLAKLGVASRHRVGPLLRNKSPEKCAA